MQNLSTEIGRTILSAPPPLRSGLPRAPARLWPWARWARIMVRPLASSPTACCSGEAATRATRWISRTERR